MISLYKKYKTQFWISQILCIGSILAYKKLKSSKCKNFKLDKFEDLFQQVKNGNEKELERLQVKFKSMMDKYLKLYASELITEDPQLTKPAVCGKGFNYQESYYECEDCVIEKSEKMHTNSYDITKSAGQFCEKCFKASNHKDHKFTLKKIEQQYQTEVGFCDCGNINMVKTCCPDHTRADDQYLQSHRLSEKAQSGLRDLIKGIIFEILHKFEYYLLNEETKKEYEKDEKKVQIIFNWTIVFIIELVKTNMKIAYEIAEILTQQFDKNQILYHDCGQREKIVLAQDNTKACECNMLECILRLSLYYDNYNKQLLFDTLKYLTIASINFRIIYGASCLKQIFALNYEKEISTADKKQIKIHVPSRYLRLVPSCFGRKEQGLAIMKKLGQNPQVIEEYFWLCLTKLFSWEEYFVYNNEAIETLSDIYYCLIDNEQVIEQVIVPNKLYIRSILKLMILIENLMPEAQTLQQYNTWLFQKGISSLVYIKEVSVMLSFMRQKIIRIMFEKSKEQQALWLSKTCFMTQFEICTSRCITMISSNMEFSTITQPFSETLLDLFMMSLKNNSVEQYPTRLSLTEFMKKYLDIEGFHEMQRMLKLLIIYYESYIFFGLQELLIRSKKNQIVGNSKIQQIFDFATYSSTTPLRGEYDRELLLRQILFLLSQEHQDTILIPFLHKMPAFIKTIAEQPQQLMMYQLTLTVQLQQLKRIFYDETSIANYIGFQGQLCQIHEDMMKPHEDSVKNLMKRCVINIMQILDQEGTLAEVSKNVQEILYDQKNQDQLIEETLKECSEFDQDHDCYKLKKEYQNQYYPLIFMRNDAYMAEKADELKNTSFANVDPLFGSDFACNTPFQFMQEIRIECFMQKVVYNDFYNDFVCEGLGQFGKIASETVCYIYRMILYVIEKFLSQEAIQAIGIERYNDHISDVQKMIYIYIKDDKVMKYLEKSLGQNYITKATYDNFKQLVDSLQDKKLE